jgi:Ala-tRNA(Pro) deacylase
MDIRSYLDEMGVHYQWSQHDPAYTAQQVAQAEHFSGNRVIKPVLVKADGQFVLCALPAGYLIDMADLRDTLKAKAVDIADERDLEKLCPDCEVGAEPPIGKLYGVPTLVDASLEDEDEVLFQAGTHRDAVRMHFSDYWKLTQPSIGQFAHPRQ